MSTLAISCLIHFQFALIYGPNIPGSYAILLFTVSDFTSITSHIHSWVLFLFWLCLFIFSGVISPLISSSILGIYQPEEFIFQCFRKTSTSALLTTTKPLTMLITTNCGKFLKMWEHQTTWSAFWETCMQVEKQQLELDMEQTGSKPGRSTSRLYIVTLFI